VKPRLFHYPPADCFLIQEEKDLQEGSSNPALSISDYFGGISED